MFKRLRAWWAARAEREARKQYENGMLYVNSELTKCASIEVFERLLREADGLCEIGDAVYNDPFNRGMVQALTEFASENDDARFHNVLTWFKG